MDEFFVDFWKSFAPAFTVSFIVCYLLARLFRLGQRAVEKLGDHVADRVEETIEAKKAETGFSPVTQWFLSTGVVLVTLWLRTRDARVTELETDLAKTKEELRRLRQEREPIIVDTGDDDEPQERFPDNDDAYIRA
jgi:hypothetical protein